MVAAAMVAAAMVVRMVLVMLVPFAYRQIDAGTICLTQKRRSHVRFVTRVRCDLRPSS